MRSFLFPVTIVSDLRIISGHTRICSSTGVGFEVSMISSSNITWRTVSSNNVLSVVESFGILFGFIKLVQALLTVSEYLNRHGCMNESIFWIRPDSIREWYSSRRFEWNVHIRIEHSGRSYYRKNMWSQCKLSDPSHFSHVATFLLLKNNSKKNIGSWIMNQMIYIKMFKS